MSLASASSTLSWFAESAGSLPGLGNSIIRIQLFEYEMAAWISLGLAPDNPVDIGCGSTIESVSLGAAAHEASVFYELLEGAAQTVHKTGCDRITDIAMTIGMVAVALLSALAAGVPPVTMTSTLPPTSATASSGSPLTLSCPYSHSIAIICPST
jgi:hypothetical protein